MQPLNNKLDPGINIHILIGNLDNNFLNLPCNLLINFYCRIFLPEPLFDLLLYVLYQLFICQTLPWSYQFSVSYTGSNTGLLFASYTCCLG